MDSVQVLAKLAALETKLVAIERELIEVASQQRDVSDFINTMKEVVTEMSANPMFRAMGIPNLTSDEKPKVERLPGMSKE